MPLPYQPWRAALLPASFGGVEFHVETGSHAGGRRIALHEFPKADIPYSEDMGRKARRWPVTAYLIGPYYLDDRDALIAVCESEGPFSFVHPTFGEKWAVCEGFVATEVREKGGFCAFELQLLEAGQSPDYGVTDNTQALATSAADTSNQTAVTSLNTGLMMANNGFATGGTV